MSMPNDIAGRGLFRGVPAEIMSAFVALAPLHCRFTIWTMSSELHERFLGLPLFADLYLRMQALNIALSDQALRDWEAALMRKYLESDGTPIQSAVFVSAFSQLWLFGLYELLRTWRERAEEIIKFAQSLSGLAVQAKQEKMAQTRAQIEARTADKSEADMRWKPFQRAVEDPAFVEAIGKAIDCSESVWRRLEELRVNLAKHQVPKSKGGFAMSPGYSRIDESTGSIYWQIDLGDKEVDIVSRQRISDQLLTQLSTECGRPFVPRALRLKLQQIPRFAYGARQCTATLDDGRRFDVVIVWNEVKVTAKNYPLIRRGSLI
jgi:hypothetical protein